MTAINDLTLLVELACLTEDRTDHEQDALLRVAASVDRKANALVVTNRRSGPPSSLYERVAGTRVGGSPRINPKVQASLRQQALRWNNASDDRQGLQAVLP